LQGRDEYEEPFPAYEVLPGEQETLHGHSQQNESRAVTLDSQHYVLSLDI